MDVNEICKIIPHRAPFLLVDRVVELVPDEHIVCIKNVSISDPFFAGHFPGKPVMPGVLIVEASAQTGAILAKLSPSLGLDQASKMLLVGIKEARFKRQVVPGDQLVIRVKIDKWKRPMLIMSGTVTVDGELVASGTLSAINNSE